MRRRLALLFCCLGYFAAATAVLSLASVHPLAMPVWPPAGIAIAAALILGRAAWLPILIASFAVNLTTGLPVPAALLIAFGNALEAVTGAFLLSRLAHGAQVLHRPSDIFRFAPLMAASVIVSSTIGVTALQATGDAFGGHFQSIWLTWWIGNLSGALIVAPLILAWADRSPAPQARAPVERALLLGGVCVVSALTFGGLGPWHRNTPVGFLTIPLLVWAAFRFTQRETATAVALMWIIATWATATGAGPFALAAANTSLVIVQAFVATLMMTMLPMSAIVVEWRRVQAARAVALARERNLRMNAEKISSAQDDFLAMLSHELRNPLGAIRAASHVLSVSDAGSDVAQRARNVIARQVSHLAGVISDLLDVTRVRTGKISLQRKPVALGAIVIRCAEALRLAGEPAEAASVHLELDPLDATWVNGDPTRLEQIVHNLLSNARKYTPAGGSIRVTLTREGDHAVLRVADTGVGIAPDLLPRIFDQFVQSESDLARTEGGLGLGLTLVRRFVELHGGTVSAASEGPGRGSVFTVRLPSIPAPAAVPAVEARMPPARRRVLVVEDQIDLRAMMCTVLKLSGHEVFEASDGPGGVEAIDRVTPDVAFIDIGIPGFDGYEVARQARARRGDAISLIALTGYGQPEDRRRAEAAGFNVHLVKPVDPARLAELAASAPTYKIGADVPSSSQAS